MLPHFSPRGFFGMRRRKILRKSGRENRGGDEAPEKIMHLQTSSARAPTPSCTQKVKKIVLFLSPSAAPPPFLPLKNKGNEVIMGLTGERKMLPLGDSKDCFFLFSEYFLVCGKPFVNQISLPNLCASAPINSRIYFGKKD